MSVGGRAHDVLGGDRAAGAGFAIDDHGLPQALGHGFPLFHGKHGAEMANRHVVRVHGAGGLVAAFAGRQVGADLVAVEVEVDPFGRAAALRTAQLFAVEGAGFGQVADREGQVERRQIVLGGHEKLRGVQKGDGLRLPRWRTAFSTRP
ncbi:hypothetical protein G6F31_019252 [Rhizopus arrhizus]|nr:hypothetical protein G6F31_019252 [Rhizopus arrhizus]